jgi:hypothetical protein
MRQLRRKAPGERVLAKAIEQTFLEAAESWVCDGYFLDIRYMAGMRDDSSQLWDAMVELSPLPPQHDYGMRISDGSFVVGQIQSGKETKKSLLKILRDAATGLIHVGDTKLCLEVGNSPSLVSEMIHPDRWFSQLHLKVIGNLASQITAFDRIAIDNALRRSNPPFDGLSDVALWLGLKVPAADRAPSIDISVLPPVDLGTCELHADELHLHLRAHSRFDVSKVGVAVWAVPGDGLKARLQVGGQIDWKISVNGLREGNAVIKLRAVENVLVMLTVESSTVRRQWFFDAAKARSNRLLAVQLFDRDLKMIKNALLDSPDSGKFEVGIAQLLFLLGFTPAVQLETDSPDLIVATPGGRLALVECTIKIADFSSKLGKLVDRRGALLKTLQAGGHLAHVTSVLVCRAPRDQIAINAEELRNHKIILVSGNELSGAFDRIRIPLDPDQWLDEVETQLGIRNA